MPNSLDIELQNHSNSDEVYAYITGLALQHNNARFLLKSNGHDLYFPESPSETLQPLQEDCAIRLGPPGSTTTVHIPQIAGGRIWFSRDAKISFLLSPGPALVEPSVLNNSDPNSSVDFAFAEFTLNESQLYANISYVDFAPRLPISLTLEEASGGVQHVSGMAEDGITRLCESLKAQAAKDGMPWDKLIVQKDGTPLRVLHPTHGNAVGANFDDYYEPFVEEVWKRYRESEANYKLSMNTQSQWGTLEGFVQSSDELMIGGERFGKPTTADILGCNTGPFITGPSAVRNAIIPRLAAAFHRTSLLDTAQHPSLSDTYYNRNPTNHYARVLHEINLDRKGYAFAYDDVQPNDAPDQSGKVNSGAPARFIIAVGGSNAYAGDRIL